jgi:hypothetical protein
MGKNEWQALLVMTENESAPWELEKIIERILIQGFL